MASPTAEGMWSAEILPAEAKVQGPVLFAFFLFFFWLYSSLLPHELLQHSQSIGYATYT